jgi:O-antigen ligase
MWCLYLAFYIVVRRILETDENAYDIFLTALTLVFVFYSIPAVIEYCGFLVFGGATTLGIRFAKYGEQINTLMPLVFVAAVRAEGKKFILWTAAIVIFWLLIVCSLGRINMIVFVILAGMMTGTILIFTRFRQYARKALVIIAACVLSAVLVNSFALLSEHGSPVANRFNAEKTESSNGFRRLMYGLSFEMFETHPVIGIGADNFGTEANKYRVPYSAKNLDDPDIENAENELPERSHNEFVQILAELGIVGAAIMALLLIGIGIFGIRIFRKDVPLVAFAAVFGIGGFFVSSLVSSYSFRFVQNGLVFFFVLAVAVGHLRTEKNIDLSRRTVGVLCVIGLALCLAFAGYSGIRAASAYYASAATKASDYSAAHSLLETSRSLDNENPQAYNIEGMWLFQEKRFSEAVPYLERGIDIGQATTTEFSYLVSSEILADDLNAAETTLREAIRLYPRSVFLQVRLVDVLKQAGKTDEAEKVLEIAENLDAGQARTWLNYIERGGRYASDQAFKNDLPPVMNLVPKRGIYAIQAEREIRFPDEKFVFPKSTESQYRPR